MAVQRILGVDPGTRVVGYAVLETPANSRFRYIECGVFKLDCEQAIHARLAELARELREVVHEFSPNRLAIESAFHGKNAASALKLAEARGAVKLVAVESGLAVHEYTPAEIKRRITGSGRATKADIQHRVAWICGLQSQPQSDAADALAVAVCHAQQELGAVRALL